MPTITVRLDKARAARLTRWARRRRIPKSDVIRAMIDRVAAIETGEDLAEWVRTASGRGLGLVRKRR
jgi:predicted transcriptional regulator